MLTPGSIVTTSKNEVDFLVTENNIVRLKGRTASERAKMIISLAAPEFRDELLFEAKKESDCISGSNTKARPKGRAFVLRFG